MVIIETGFALLVVGVVIFFAATVLYHIWKRYEARLNAEDEWQEERRRKFPRGHDEL